MKKISLFILFTCVFYQVYPQINATTNSGKKVILNNDGTWKYDENKTTIIGLGEWEVKYFVDDFGDPTSQGYITNQDLISGTFSNSATNNSKLLAYFIIKDSSNVAIKLLEYGSNTVKAYSTKTYSVLIKDSNGEKHSMTGTMYKGGDRMYVDDSYKKKHVSDLHKLLINGEKLTIVITDKEYGLTKYQFSINGDGYKNAINQLF